MFLKLAMFLWKIFLFVSAVYSSGCPFKRLYDEETEENLYKIYHQSLYTKGLDEETQKRPDPTQKNNYGHCPNNECVLNSRFRTFNGMGAYTNYVAIFWKFLPPPPPFVATFTI